MPRIRSRTRAGVTATAVLAALLTGGTNRLTFTAEELPDFNGDTYHQYDQRSPYAPVIDRIAVTPLAEK
ncbi:hypothetical protein [Streptomyces sp. NPDC047043]|uniref:hypothetical protein n=1 Tax=Streptomyces sp. NPDC047043 TaxID=3154497 RepID=UPI00340865E5